MVQAGGAILLLIPLFHHRIPDKRLRLEQRSHRTWESFWSTHIHRSSEEPAAVRQGRTSRVSLWNNVWNNHNHVFLIPQLTRSRLKEGGVLLTLISFLLSNELNWGCLSTFWLFFAQEPSSCRLVKPKERTIYHTLFSHVLEFVSGPGSLFS